MVLVLFVSLCERVPMHTQPPVPSYRRELEAAPSSVRFSGQSAVCIGWWKCGTSRPRWGSPSQEAQALETYCQADAKREAGRESCSCAGTQFVAISWSNLSVLCPPPPPPCCADSIDLSGFNLFSVQFVLDSPVLCHAISCCIVFFVFAYFCEVVLPLFQKNISCRCASWSVI